MTRPIPPAGTRRLEDTLRRAAAAHPPIPSDRTPLEIPVHG
ncbi:MAG: hypothetical protein P4L36_08720 [Holophaga sp.]|nr:hypothetical protein [Holophaga sp.]